MNDIILVKNNNKDIKLILSTNKITDDKNLAFSSSEALELVINKNNVLNSIGRIEIDNTIIDKIILSFYDSEYIDLENYFEVINSLVETFYIYQNKFSNYLIDDELIEYLRECYDKCGSIELLNSLYFDKLNYKITYGDFYE